MEFEYDELAQPDSEIRIAVVEPGSFEDPLVVRFITRVLKDDAPVYQALSYVWGSNENPSCVHISSARPSGTVSITKNLDVALRHLRSEKKPRSLWIDALCINQAGTEEKDVQVMNMGNIFKTARSVIAWLGPEDQKGDEGIRLLRNLGNKVNVDWRTRIRSPRTRTVTQALTRREERERSLTLEIIQGRLLPWTITQSISVYSIFSKPYFRRAWVVQEIKLARRVEFQYGYTMLPENTLWKAAVLLWRLNSPQIGMTGPEEWDRRLKPLWRLANIRTTGSESYMSILSVRHNLGHLECSDPRDKLYSFLGIMDALSKELQIIPTYSETTQSVYINVTQRVYNKMSTLDLIADCDLAPNEWDMPSWVPDWSKPMRVHRYGVRWSACAWIAAQATFDESGLRCTVSGTSIGSVVEVGELCPNAWTWFECFVFLQALRPAPEILESEYITGETMLEVYCRILASDSLQHSGRPPRMSLPDFDKSLEALRQLWSQDSSDDREVQFDAMLRTSQLYLDTVNTMLSGRRLFKTQTGHLGLAPAETQTGDLLCILLGARRPVILRPAADNTYLVVGCCYTHGLMDGEAIYHNSYTEQRNLRIMERNGYPDLVNCGDGTCYYDADEMLEGAGIRIERRIQGPVENIDMFVVLPETLRAVGIQVEDFVLV